MAEAEGEKKREGEEEGEGKKKEGEEKSKRQESQQREGCKPRHERDKTGAQDRFIKCGVHSAAYSAKEKSEGIRAFLGERGARATQSPFTLRRCAPVSGHDFYTLRRASILISL